MNLVIRKSASGPWDVRAAGRTSSTPLFTGGELLAEIYARREISANGGGRLTVKNEAGRVLSTLTVPGGSALLSTGIQRATAAPSTEEHPATPAGGGPSKLAESIIDAADKTVTSFRDDQKGTGDHLVDLTESGLDVAAKANIPVAVALSKAGKQMDNVLAVVLPLLTLAGSAGSVLLYPEVTSLGSTWIAIFLATLTWSLGCALGYFVIRYSEISGAQAFFIVGACFIASQAVAVGLGVGVLDVDPLTAGSGPTGFIQLFLRAAMTAYGPAGVVISGGIGLIVGHIVWKHSDPKAGIA